MKILRKTSVGPNFAGSYKKECDQNGTVEINCYEKNYYYRMYSPLVKFRYNFVMEKPQKMYKIVYSMQLSSALWNIVEYATL